MDETKNNPTVESTEEAPSYVNGVPQYGEGAAPVDGRPLQPQGWTQPTPNPNPVPAQGGGYQNPYSAQPTPEGSPAPAQGGGYQNPYSAHQPEGFTNQHMQYTGQPQGHATYQNGPQGHATYQNGPAGQVNYHEPQGHATYINGNYSHPANQGTAPEFVLWLVLGIIQILLCCCSCVSIITGTLSIVFAVLANSAYKNGNYETYESHIKVAKIVNLVGWGIIVLLPVISAIAGNFRLDAIYKNTPWPNFMPDLPF